jgi:gamma-glutamylcyclotransferase (GGCT)/AIG2-like uncharacterized protein YtfP
MNLLFVYGTLLPLQPRWHHLERWLPEGHTGATDRVAGWLFDTGEGYPAAVFGGDEHIVGRVMWLRPEQLDAALDHLDEVEGAVAGEYRRVQVITETGREAWAYEYGGGLTVEPIEDGSWLAHLARSSS